MNVQAKRMIFSASLALVLAAASTHAQQADTPAHTTAIPAAGPTPPCDPQQVASLKARFQDWAGLQRYAKDDAALPPASSPNDRVVFMGDSITDAWGRLSDTGAFFPGRPYINRGISGQTTPQMLVRFEQDVVHLQPAAVVLLAGTNDIAGNTGPTTPRSIEDNYTAMTQIARANGIKVVLASITPADHYNWKPGINPVAEIRELNTWMQTFCADGACQYLNYYAAMSDPNGSMLPGYSKDGVHPTAKGYSVMAPLAEQAIQTALHTR